MVSTAEFGEATGSAGKMTTGSQNYDFKNIDDVGIPSTGSNYADYPITTGSNSFTKEIFFRWGGTFNKIEKVLFYKSAGATGSGVSIVGNSGSAIQNTFFTPYTSGSTDTTVPTTLATAYGVNLGAGPSPTGSTSATGSTAVTTVSGFLRLQLKTDTTATAGDIASQTWTLQWDES